MQLINPGIQFLGQQAGKSNKPAEAFKKKEKACNAEESDAKRN